MNVLLTGDIDRSRRIWTNAVSIEIRAQDNDIHSYFDMQKSRLPQSIIEDEKLQQQIKQAMVEVAQGRYALTLQIDRSTYTNTSQIFNGISLSEIFRQTRLQLDVDVGRRKNTMIFTGISSKRVQSQKGQLRTPCFFG